MKYGTIELTEAEREHIISGLKETITRFEESIPISENALQMVLKAMIDFDKKLIKKLNNMKFSEKEVDER